LEFGKKNDAISVKMRLKRSRACLDSSAGTEKISDLTCLPDTASFTQKTSDKIKTKNAKRVKFWMELELYREACFLHLTEFSCKDKMSFLNKFWGHVRINLYFFNLFE